MIGIEIDQKVIDEAKGNVAQYNQFNLFGGAYVQKLVGELGRLALRIYLEVNKFQYKEDTHIGSKDEYDFIIENKNVSLKTQLINYDPKPSWRCEVLIGQLNNPCDYYIFTKCFLKRNFVYLCGCISKNDFDIKGIVRQTGTLLDDNVTPWNVKESKKDVQISDLHIIEVLKFV